MMMVDANLPTFVCRSLTWDLGRTVFRFFRTASNKPKHWLQYVMIPYPMSKNLPSYTQSPTKTPVKRSLFTKLRPDHDKEHQGNRNLKLEATGSMQRCHFICLEKRLPSRWKTFSIYSIAGWWLEKNIWKMWKSNLLSDKKYKKICWQNWQNHRKPIIG